MQKYVNPVKKSSRSSRLSYLGYTLVFTKINEAVNLNKSTIINVDLTMRT